MREQDAPATLIAQYRLGALSGDQPLPGTNTGADQAEGSLQRSR